MSVASAVPHSMATPLNLNSQVMMHQWCGVSVPMPFTFSASTSGCHHNQSSDALSAEDHGNLNKQRQGGQRNHHHRHHRQ